MTYRGNFIRAKEHLEQALELYDQHWTKDMTIEQSMDLGVSCLCHLILIQWLLGTPDQAQASTQRVMRLDNKAEHPYSMAEALYFLALFHQIRREPQLCLQQAEACIGLSAQYGFQEWLGYAVLLKSWAQTELGAAQEGIAQLQQSLGIYQAIGIGLARPAFLGLQAMAYTHLDQPEDGLALLDEALMLAEDREEHYFAAELHRMKGELLMLTQPETPTAALACFQQSLSAARAQQAKSLELRAVLSLCRLLQGQDRLADVRGLLEDICGRFTEGFRTPEFQQAQTLLQTL